MIWPLTDKRTTGKGGISNASEFYETDQTSVDQPKDANETLTDFEQGYSFN